MIETIRQEILNNLRFNDEYIKKNNIYSNIFIFFNQKYCDYSLEKCIDDMNINNIKINGFNEYDCYNKLIANLIQKQLFEKFKLDVNDICITFKLNDYEEFSHYKTYIIYKSQIILDRKKIIKQLFSDKQNDNVVYVDNYENELFFNIRHINSEGFKELKNIEKKIKQIEKCIDDIETKLNKELSNI